MSNPTLFNSKSFSIARHHRHPQADIDIGDSDEPEVEEERVEVTTLNPVVSKATKWKNRLTPEQRARIPEILSGYVGNDRDTLGPVSFFVRTRARQRFMEVFGRGVHESHEVCNARV